MNNLQLVRPSEAAALLSVSIPTFYRMCKEPDFPNKIKLHKRAVGYKKSELLAWVEERAESNQEPIPA